MNSLKKCDFMGTDFKFTVDREKYKTGLGGLFSILLVVSALVSCWYFGQDIYVRRNPFYLSKMNYWNQYPNQALDNSNFIFAVAIQDANNNPITDRSYFTHEFTY